MSERFIWKTWDWMVPMVYFHYNAICRQTFWYFYIFSLLFGTRAHYSLAFNIHCVYYLFKVETLGRGKKCRKCQQRYLSDVHGIVLVSQMILWVHFKHLTFVFILLVWLVSTIWWWIFSQSFCIYNLLFIWYKWSRLYL